VTWKEATGSLEPTDAADGKFVFTQWLGDNLQTRNIFSVEAKDTYAVVVHEHRTVIGGYPVGSAPFNGWPSGANGTGSANYGVLAVEQNYWGVSTTWSVGDKIGATSTVLGAAALLSVLSCF
jgi:hypothetical protein